MEIEKNDNTFEEITDFPEQDTFNTDDMSVVCDEESEGV